jgi:hypothetical protein
VSGDFDLKVYEVHQITVKCGAHGPVMAADGEGTERWATLADLEEFCAKLRAYGAPGHTPVRVPAAVTAVLNLPTQISLEGEPP